MSPPESIGYPANALQGQNKLQHSTSLLCTVLSDTGHQHECPVALGENHMAKKSKRRKDRSNSRVHLDSTSRRTLAQMRDPFPGRSRLLPRRFVKPESFRSIINRQIEDLRHDASNFVNDNQVGPVYRDTSGSVAETEWQHIRKSDMQGKNMQPQVRIAFRNPKNALVCVRRRARRAVMFALRRTGKAGARNNRKAVWSDKSRIVCKKR